MKIERVHIDPQDTRKTNIARLYDLEGADWITHPDGKSEDKLLLEFRNTFTVDGPSELLIHISADQRFELSLNGEFFSAGPDRCDVEHWSFSSWKIQIGKGEHTFSCLQWYLGDEGAPAAQIHLRPAFIFCCSDEKYASLLDTGRGNWLVRRLNGLSFDTAAKYNIMPHAILDMRAFSTPGRWMAPIVVRKGFETANTGGMRPLWRLYPSELPEQFRKLHETCPGRVRAVYTPAAQRGSHFITAAEIDSPALEMWQTFFTKGVPVTLAPHTAVSVLLDLEEYYCACNRLYARGGGKEKISIVWRESLYEPVTFDKGNRGEVIGKFQDERCDADIFTNLPEESVLCRHFWWHSGRYIELTVETEDSPVTLERFSLLETRYPLENKGKIHFGLPVLDDPVKLYTRVMQMCTHETFMDCPFYEQLMYIGDGRLEALVFYMMEPSAAMPLRVSLLFSWSRKAAWEGLAGEHYPSRIPQLSATFSMLYPAMVLDLLKYRSVEKKTAFRLRNQIRSTIDALSEYLNGDDLMEDLPGWSFVDWVNEWNPNGVSEVREEDDVRKGNTSAQCMFSMQFLFALQNAAEAEEYEGGSLHRKAFYQELFNRVKAAVFKHFYLPERGIFANNSRGRDLCEHNQIMAIITKILTEDQQKKCFDALLNAPDLYRTTVYYKFYLFEAFRIMGQAHLISRCMDTWSEFLAKDAKTTFERPGRSRSDCHAWGAHPLYHYYSSIAGIRPGSFGFRTVDVAPQMGDLPFVQGSMVHPEGFIGFTFKNMPREFHAEITLPQKTTGSFTLYGQRIKLTEGFNKILMKKLF